MARVAATALMVTAICFSATARAQPVACCGIGVDDVDLADVKPEVEAPPPAPPLTLPLPPCCGMAAIAPGEPSDGELTGVIAGAASAAVVSYLLATLFASTQPHNVPLVDGIPVLGAIVAASRNPLDDRTTPLLLFSAGVQAIGILVAATVGVGLAERRQIRLDFGACPSGAGASVSWHF